MRFGGIKKYIDFFKSGRKESIKDICDKYGIKRYTINLDKSVDVNWNCKIDDLNLSELPIKFNKVCGFFSCDKNMLVTLDGCPKFVDSDFYCRNNQLISLKGCPELINGDFTCSNNKLITLEGSPKNIKGSFNCNKNQLLSLENGPISVDDGFDCSHNKLTTLKGCPEFVDGSFNCSDNILTSLEGFPENYEGRVFIWNNPVNEILRLFPLDIYHKAIFWINEFEVIRDGKQVVLDRLEEVFIQMNLKVPVNIKFNSYEII